MRDFIRIVETAHRPISEGFLEALREWGDNTIFDRNIKESMLRRYSDEAVRFQPRHDWLYRGQCIEESDFGELQRGGTIAIDLGGSLSSWTADSDVAHTFARFAACDASIVIMKRGLRTFVDFERLGEMLEASGGFPHHEDYPLHDPIREKEIIVDHPEIIEITKADVLEGFGFDPNGRQTFWHPGG